MKFSANILNVKICQSCQEPLGNVVYDSSIDNTVAYGCWGYICETCFDKWGNPGVASKHHNKV